MFTSNLSFIGNANSSDQQPIIQPVKLAQHVNDWLLHEMEIGQNRQASQVMPSLSQIRELCRGNMVDVWLFLLGNIYSPSRVDSMKKNVLLYGNKAQEERVKRERRRLELTTQIQMTQQRIKELRESEIPKVTFELKQIKSELSALDLQESNKEKRAMTLCQQNCILKCFDEKCASNHIVLADFGDRLENVYRGLTQQSDSMSCQSVAATDNEMTDSSDYTQPQGLIHAIEDACKEMSKQYTELLSKYTSPGENVHQTIAHTSRSRPQEMVEVLSNLTREDSDRVVHSMNSLSVQHDIEEVETRCEQLSSMKDSDGIDLRDTKKILTERRKEHIASFIESERLLNQAATTQEKLDRLIHETQIKLQHVDSHKTVALGKLLQVEMKHNGLASAKEVMEHRLGKLRELRDKYRSIYHTLELKKQKINTFDEQNSHRQNLIRDLMKDISYIQRVVEDKKKIIHSILQTDLSEVNSQFVTTIPKYVSAMQDGITRELQAFSSLPWYRLYPESDQQLDTLHSQWLKQVSLPDFTTIDALVTQMTELQFEEYEARMNVQLHQHMMKKVNIECSNPSDEEINEVMRACSDLLNQDQASWLQTINQAMESCEAIQKVFDETDRLADEWWNRPVSKLDWADLTTK